jgi:aryl carrier-like protein
MALAQARGSMRERLAALTDVQRDRLALELESCAGFHSVVDRPLKRIVVYWESTGSGRATEVELRRYLSERLPDYMLPSLLLALDEIPRTPSGKFDRKRLPRPSADASRPANGEGVETSGSGEPRNEAERILCDVWKEVLSLDFVSIYDDFFEVGGDSLLSIRVLSRARRKGIEIEPERFFTNPTIAKWSESLDRESAQSDTPASGDAAPVSLAREDDSSDAELSGLEADELAAVGALLAQIDDD